MPSKSKENKNTQEKDNQTDSQDTQHRENSNSSEESLENFIGDQEKQTEDIEINDQSKSGGISGLDPQEISAILTTTLAQNVPKEKRQDFADSYQPTVYQILLFIDFEDLTKGANVKELPGWIRGLIALGSIGIFSVFTLSQYKEKTYEDQKEELDKKEEWRE